MYQRHFLFVLPNLKTWPDRLYFPRAGATQKCVALAQSGERMACVKNGWTKRNCAGTLILYTTNNAETVVCKQIVNIFNPQKIIVISPSRKSLDTAPGHLKLSIPDGFMIWNANEALLMFWFLYSYSTEKELRLSSVPSRKFQRLHRIRPGGRPNPALLYCPIIIWVQLSPITSNCYYVLFRYLF